MSTRRFQPRPLDFPVFPWDLLVPFKRLAASHPHGVVDLSVGTPVDDTPDSIQQVLRANANAPGYPTVFGTFQVREAIANWAREKRDSVCIEPGNCFPTVGSKELIANLGWQLGLGPADKVLYPDCAYPTYEICARACGAQPIPVSRDIATWPTDAKLVWINTPGNPDGWVASEQYLREAVAWAREHGALVASDECYAPLTFSEPYVGKHTPSIISREVCGESADNVLLVYSLSKQSNLAGYRAAFIAGDETVVRHILGVRKHCGFIVPAMVQSALAQALADDESVERQVRLYARRREILKRALQGAGLECAEQCEAGLYLWVKDVNASGSDSFAARVFAAYPQREQVELADGEFIPEGEDWSLLHALAALGICTSPAHFYQDNLREDLSHVRIALSAGDSQIEAAVDRLEEFFVSRNLA